MRKTSLVGLAVLALAWAPRARAHVTFQATLDVLQEVPTPPTPSTGAGTAMLAFDDEAKTIEYTIDFQNLTDRPLLAHIHGGAAGTAGPVLGCCTLDVLAATGPSGTLAGTTQPLSEADEAALLAGNLYVNLHTQGNPLGEIRGQVTLGPGKCDCATLSRAEFKGCVKAAIKNIDADDRGSPELKRLKKFVKKSSCGRTSGPRQAIACCLPRVLEDNIVVDTLCGAVPTKACTKFGGTVSTAATTCFPTNPCNLQ